VNVNSRAATGKLDGSAKGGVKGLQPVICISIGIFSSFNLTVPKGNFPSNVLSAKRGKPYVLPVKPFPLFVPNPLPRFPKILEDGTGPSSTFAIFPLSRFKQMAENIWGSLNISGALRNEKCE